MPTNQTGQRKDITGEKVKALFQKLEQGAKEVFTSEKYAEYLRMMAKFHTYSYRNVLLILLQRPTATRVAGYNSWQNNFNRHVKRNETGIQILGYAPYKRTVERTKLGRNGKPLLDAQGNPIKEKAVITVPAYKPVYVYDVSQTDGEPLPEFISKLKGDNVADFRLLLTALTELSPYPVSFENIQGDANGYCDHTEKRIVVQQGMSQEMTLKTTVHEIAHAREHSAGKFPEGEVPNRRTKEVEAESIAFIVCEHLGIDTSDYSFGYVAGWSSNHSLKELGESMSHIQKAATQMIEKLDDIVEKTRTRETESPQAQVRQQTPNTFSIYQLRPGSQTNGLLFHPYALAKGSIKRSNYDLVYTGPLEPGPDVTDTLESIYERFNLDPPGNFKGHSLSVSDVVVLHQNGQDTAHYVDLSGFKDVPEFIHLPEEQQSKISTICTNAIARAAEINAAHSAPSRQPEHNYEIEK